MQLILTFIILGVTIILFVSNRVRSDLVAIFALLSFLLTGILSPSESFAGFSNPVVIMLGGLFIVGAGLVQTGLAKMAGNLIIRWSGDREGRVFLLLLVIVAFVGAFMSNTGTVALMLPVVISVAISIGSNPSKFLIPLSYIASLSGLLTLIASTPNLIVSEVLVENGLEPLGFFEITPIGMIGIITGILYFLVVKNTLLPNKKEKGDSQAIYRLSPNQIAKDYQIGDQLFQVKIPPGSTLEGKQLAEIKLPANYHLCILKIDRKSSDGIHFLPITYQEMAGPTTVLDENDLLYIQGGKEDTLRFVEDYKLILEEGNPEADALVCKQLGIAEALLTPHSSIINKTVSTIGFREKYNLNILAINRKGSYLLNDMSEQRLRFGDAILVQGSWEEIELLSRETRDVVVVGQPQEHASIASASGKAPIAAMIMIAMVLLMVLEVFPVVVSVLIGAVLMIVTGCLRNMDDAYSKVNWESLVLVAAMLPMATALEKTGGMTMLADLILKLLGDFGAYGVLVGIYSLTVLFGQFISNTATAVLFAPIAIQAAMTMDANPYTFMIAVAAASGMAFATPIASPTNALVMTAGGYKFMDFVKVGVPLQLVMLIVMMIAIPLFFPL